MPASGASNPETMLTSVVLPLPERPNRAMTPGVGAVKRALRVVIETVRVHYAG